MTWTRDQWIRFLYAGLCIAAAPLGLSPARAQGFGPDPFRPFNSQYDQYVYPIRPETGGAAMPGRGLGRNDNQFQQYLLGLEGEARLSSERYGAGVPYWRVRTDFNEEKRNRLNRRNDRNDDVLGSITQKYLAYFSEQSPRRRAMLLREYTPSRRGENREGVAGRLDDGDSEEIGPGLDLGRRSRREAGGRSAASSLLRGSADMSEERSGRRIPPAPLPSRFSGGSSRTQRRPSDVLDRSRKLDDDGPNVPAPRVKRRPNPEKADRTSKDDE